MNPFSLDGHGTIESPNLTGTVGINTLQFALNSDFVSDYMTYNSIQVDKFISVNMNVL